MKKKRLGNIVMVLLIAVIAVTGVLTEKHIRGGEDTAIWEACTKLRRFRTILSSPRGRKGTSALSPSSVTQFWTI